MKKKILTVAFAVAVSLTQTVFAGNTGGLKVDKIVLESFRKDFILTSEARWNKIGEIFVVDFKQEGIAYTAYYTEEGMLNSISNIIEKEKLPVAVTQRINKKYGKVEIIRALKVRSLPNGISYVLQFYAKGSEKIVKTDGDGVIETVKIIK